MLIDLSDFFNTRKRYIMSKYLSILLLGSCCILISSNVNSNAKEKCSDRLHKCDNVLKSACEVYKYPDAKKWCLVALEAAKKYKSPCLAGYGLEVDHSDCEMK